MLANVTVKYFFPQTARERFPDTSLSSIANEGGDRVIQVPLVML